MYSGASTADMLLDQVGASHLKGVTRRTLETSRRYLPAHIETGTETRRIPRMVLLLQESPINAEANTKSFQGFLLRLDSMRSKQPRH